MKISICIPQYNRIEFLLKSLRIIEDQTYENIEICISDDCSTDDTVEKIAELSKTYKYPIIFHKFSENMGYDRNYRKCIEIGTGDYAFVIGNDDSINGNTSIQELVQFLIENNYPDIGFANMLEERTGGTVIKRAMNTQVLGTGPEAAIKYYSCFVFVGGLIYKRDTFLKYNTSIHDGSVFSQLYLSVFLICNGATLFSIKEPIVIKDILLNGTFRHSYRDRIAKKWSKFRVVNAGLPSVMHVVISGLRDAGLLEQHHIYKIFRRVYLITYPQWILDYKENNALPEAVGIFVGLNPFKNNDFKLLNIPNRVIIFCLYITTSIVAFITPIFLYKKVKQRLYEYFKR